MPDRSIRQSLASPSNSRHWRRPSTPRRDRNPRSGGNSNRNGEAPPEAPKEEDIYFSFESKGSEARYLRTEKALAEWAVTEYDMGSQI